MKSLFLAMFVALSCPALTQDARTPTVVLGPNTKTSACTVPSAPVSGVPILCKPCIFYAGDVAGDDPNSNAFANGNSLGVPDTTVYTALSVPKRTRVVITGILFMEYDDTSRYFDPDTATYDIRTGVSESNGGVSIASGSAKMAYQMISRCPFVTFETAVYLSSPVTVTPGTTYWFNLSPQCTNPGNDYCNFVPGYLENTTQESNGLHAGAQPPGQMFFNSAYFGYTWANLCDPAFGQNAAGCARGSFGLMGHK
jgi:hypothetical protein